MEVVLCYNIPMMKKIFCGFVLVFMTFGFITNIKAEEVNFDLKKINYNLPYPGILPDHQLYFIKVVRDSVLEFFTRDYIKKAELNLLLADKKAVMALELSKKNKWSMAKKYILQAESYYPKIVENIDVSKKQGKSASGDFILKIKLSNEKHKEIIEDLIKNAPKGEAVNFEQALKLNKEVNNKLAKI